MPFEPRARRWLGQADIHPGETIEFFAFEREEQVLELVEGRRENQEQSLQTGVAVRVLREDRMGFAFRVDASDRAAAETLNAARAVAAAAEPRPQVGLPSPSARPAAVASSPHPFLSFSQLETTLQTLVAAVRPSTPATLRVPQAMAREREFRLELANSLGLHAQWSKPQVMLITAVMAEGQGDTQLAEASRTARQWAELAPQELGRIAADQACRSLGARPLATGRRTVLLPPSVAAGLWEAAWEAFSGEAKNRGRTFLAQQEGQRVAVPLIEVVDDGTWPSGWGSAPWDEEGTPSQRTVLIAEGILRGFLYNESSARVAGRRSTGNGQRQSLRTPPGVGPSNFMLLAGGETPEDLARRAGAGLFVTELLGLHTLNPVTGEFSLGVSGWTLDQGRPGQPVRGMTLAGNLGQVLSQVVALGNDLQGQGAFFSPSMLIDDLMVAGN